MTNFTLAAQELLARRKAGTKAARLDEAIRPRCIDDALAIHAEMAKLQHVGGWKCVLPPAEGKIIAAPIFNVQQNASTVSLFEDKGVARVEPEICFVLAKGLPLQEVQYTEAEIIDAIGSAHMALELMQIRFAEDAGQSFYENLADCMFNQGVYIGPEIDKHQAVNCSSVTIKVATGDDESTLAGKHPNSRAIDGLVWLVNFMNSRGVSFDAGTAVITGSFKGIVNMEFEHVTTIEYVGLGSYSVTFTRNPSVQKSSQ